MTDDSRILELVEEVLDDGITPEEVCAQNPNLLEDVKACLDECRNVDRLIEHYFSPVPATGSSRVRPLPGARLPTIPGYEVLEILGQGGSGIVYRVRHLKLKRVAALKMLRSGEYASSVELARFMREAEADAALQHPNIVQVYDFGEIDGRAYFTMEFVAGGSLARKLAGVPQPVHDCASIMETLARAMHAAHLAGIVHRDLKPANILLAPDGTPKITDFGLARYFEGHSDVTLGPTKVGTPSYMAPEQVTGGPGTVGPSADVYALGATLYEMLTGRPPFRGETPAETERQLLSHEPVPPSRLNAKVPRDLETVCLKCLQKGPERRYASAAALADDLRRFLERRPIHARPPSRGGRLWRWSRRNPAAAALVATAVALVGVAVGAGFWLERQHADAREAEARQTDAAEAALEHADDLRKLGHWPEARATLAGAPNLLGNSVPARLRERLYRARADADMVVLLEDVRLRLSEGRVVQGRASPTADRLYSEAFATYGITLKSSDTAAAAEMVRGSDIRDTLLVFLHDWLYWVTDENRARLRALVEAADDDPWRREFRDARARNDVAELEELARAPQAATEPSAILSGLGGALLTDDRRDEASALLRAAQQRHPGDFWINYLLGHLLERDRPQEAVGYFRAAVAIRPGSDQAYALLGRALREAGDADEAVVALYKSVELNTSRAGISELATLLAPSGRLEEARALWEKLLRRDPPDHESWYGYAQLCLFLGQVDEYRRVREAMLRRFGQSDDWIVAERTSLASLLLPASGEELQRVAALADRAVADASKSAEPDNAYVQFVKGLSEYRQGHDEQAAIWLGKAAARLTDRPGPRLVLAMAQSRSGSAMEARRTLATAVAAYDWKEPHDDHPTVWISHVLRREAESMLLPDLPAFLQGKYQPRDNDERLALLGICQSQGRNGLAAQLYVDAFAADPGLADALTADCFHRALREGDPHNRIEVLKTEARYLAARCAASAGCGRGEDGPKLNDVERNRWRNQARRWLRDDLTAWIKALDGGLESAPDLVTRMLTLWQVDPDLAELREPDALIKLPAEERREWIAIWTQIRTVITRAQQMMEILTYN